MTKQIKYFLLGQILIVFVFSCKYERGIFRDGREKTTNTRIRYPARGTSYTKTGRSTTVDTVANYVVSKSRYKVRSGCFNYHIVRQKTIYYNSEHKRTEKVVIRNGKKKTVEYLKNSDKVKSNFTSTDTLKTTTDSTKIK